MTIIKTIKQVPLLFTGGFMHGRWFTGSWQVSTWRGAASRLGLEGKSLHVFTSSWIHFFYFGTCVLNWVCFFCYVPVIQSSDHLPCCRSLPPNQVRIFLWIASASLLLQIFLLYCPYFCKGYNFWVHPHGHTGCVYYSFIISSIIY